MKQPGTMLRSCRIALLWLPLLMGTGQFAASQDSPPRRTPAIQRIEDSLTTVYREAVLSWWKAIGEARAGPAAVLVYPYAWGASVMAQDEPVVTTEGACCVRTGEGGLDLGEMVDSMESRLRSLSATGGGLARGYGYADTVGWASKGGGTFRLHVEDNQLNCLESSYLIQVAADGETVAVSLSRNSETPCVASFMQIPAARGRALGQWSFRTVPADSAAPLWGEYTGVVTLYPDSVIFQVTSGLLRAHPRLTAPITIDSIAPAFEKTVPCCILGSSRGEPALALGITLQPGSSAAVPPFTLRTLVGNSGSIVAQPGEDYWLAMVHWPRLGCGRHQRNRQGQCPPWTWFHARTPVMVLMESGE
jgi:hypothetical protein